MRKAMMITSIAAIVAGGIFTSCDSAQKKADDTTVKVEETKNEQVEAQKELNAEYPAYKTAAVERITTNEKEIARLRETISKPGKPPLDGMRKKKIDDLEEKNAALRSRLYGYERERTDWETFKRDFSHDMDDLGTGFKNLGTGE